MARLSRRLGVALAAGAALAAAAAPALAHHSFAMFDRAVNRDLEGVVKSFAHVNPARLPADRRGGEERQDADLDG